AYDFFEPLQTLDGYDIVEAVAAQDWVLGHRIGLVGLSYPGLSQLWVAQTRPPSLVAITPLSVIADTVSSTLAPGGIFNDGFALNWAEGVLDGAAPYGQGWEQGLVAEGDEVCEENQLLHGQAIDTVKKAQMHPFYVDSVADPLNPSLFAEKIDIPVFLAGGWQDEQTGGHFPALFDKFTNAPLTRFTAYNGIHQDGYAPELLVEWKNFLDFHVALEVPEIDPVLRTLAPILIESVFGAAVEFPPDRFAMFESFDEAYAAYEAEPDIQILFDVGDSPLYTPGVPASSFQASFEQWPLTETTPVRWYLQPDGTLAEDIPPADGGSSEFVHDPQAGRTLNLAGNVNDVLPDWNWIQDAPGTAAVFVSEALSEDTVMVGSASADLWIRSSADEADLEVTISEVRPDGQEMYVQSGWLRVSHRQLAPEATDLRPIKTHQESDWQPLTPGEWVEARIEIFPFGHAFRAGSKVRIAVDTPGETRAEWTFILADYMDEEVLHDVGHSAEHPSSVLLPVVPGIEVPSDLPPCPSLRGQPCHTFEDYTNTPSIP
ncbi:MAG: CocE/NonD family hydrolase, partial [Nannocystaceae bacterium]